MLFKRFKSKKHKHVAVRQRKQTSSISFRSRAQTSGTKLRFCMRIVIIFLCLASVVVLVWVGTKMIACSLFSRNDLFAITDYKIECSGEVIKPEHVMEYLSLNSCSNLFALNIGAIREKLLNSVPRIKEAEISRHIPGVLSIRINERIPVARINMGSYFLTVDRTGRVLGPSVGARALPVINGHDLRGLKPGSHLRGTHMLNTLEVLDICLATSIGRTLQVQSFELQEKEYLKFRLVGGANVLLAWEGMKKHTAQSRRNLEDKLNKLTDCLKQSAALGKRIAFIDMTLENNFPAKYY